VYEELIRRRERRRIARRIQAGVLAFVVIAGTVAGIYGLSRVFRAGPGEQVTPAGPQNGSIVFSNMGADGHNHLFTIDPDGTGQTQLTDFRTNDSDPTVSPDGRTIAFAHELDTGQRVIASIPFAGGAVTWLTDPKLEADGPAWSPDGNSIAFSASSRGIFVIRPNGTGVRQVVAGGEVFNALDLAWSPDGSQLAFMATTEPRCGEGCKTGLPYDIFRIDIDGSDLVNLTQTPDRSEVYPSWAPDGNVIAISVGHSDEGVPGLYLIDPGGRLHESPIVPSEYAIDAAWSPDGEFLVFQGDADPSGKEFDTQLWIARPDGRDLHQITVVGGSEPAWQALPGGTTAATPTPATSPQQEAGLDIGLAFRLCDVSSMGGIDFLGDGTLGRAWTGIPVPDGGICPKLATPAEGYGVAVDFTGDGTADDWSRTIDYCMACGPWDATDLNGDGAEELIVVGQLWSVPDYGVYVLTGNPADGSARLERVRVAAPGHPEAGYEPGAFLTLSAGGDAGNSDYISCEGYPDSPVLTQVNSFHPPDGPGSETRTVSITRFVFESGGPARVVGAETFEQPTDQPVPYANQDGKACGVDFNP
jgi:TolB protein